MSKDKGSKNHKKAPADKAGKVKVISAYKTDRSGGGEKATPLQAFVPKDISPAKNKKA